MSISSIGVQQILPQSGTNWERPNPVVEAGNPVDQGDLAAKPDRGPKTPETGTVVDKVA